jgi:hypothetical protein
VTFQNRASANRNSVRGHFPKKIKNPLGHPALDFALKYIGEGYRRKRRE